MLNSWKKLALAMAIAATAGSAVALAVTDPGYGGGTPKVAEKVSLIGPRTFVANTAQSYVATVKNTGTAKVKNLLLEVQPSKLPKGPGVTIQKASLPYTIANGWTQFAFHNVPYKGVRKVALTLYFQALPQGYSHWFVGVRSRPMHVKPVAYISVNIYQQ